MVLVEVFYTLSLVLVATLCVVGLWCTHFKENLFQNIGLAFVGAGCIVRLGCMVIGQPVEATRYMVMYGLALYGLGTAWKVYKFRWENK